MHRLLALLAVVGLALTQIRAEPLQDASPAELRERAIRMRAEGSHALAARALEELLALDVERPEAETRMLRVWWHDSRWRASAATQRADQPELDEAREALEGLIASYQRPETRDAAWAAAHGSLGDWHWKRRNRMHWSAAWPHYRAALGHWAGSSDLDRARREYLDLAFRATTSRDVLDWRHTNHLRGVPQDLLERAARVAQQPEDVAWTHFSLALGLASRELLPAHHDRVREAFEAAVRTGVEPWADHALYRQAVWCEEHGESYRDDQGRARTRPDYVRAAALYRAYLERYGRGSGRHWSDARQRLDRITATELAVSVDGAFLPGSAQRFALRWRNAGEVRLSLTPVDLTREVDLSDEDHRVHQWLDRVEARAEPARSWTHATGDEGEHRRGDATLEVSEPVGEGAWLLRATSNGETSRALVLVSETAVVLKEVGGALVAWVAAVADGRPRAEATVALWHRADGDRPWKRYEAVTDAEGLARFEGLGGERGRSFVAVRAGDQQAFATVHGASHLRHSTDWRLYVSTDRPAYRPGDEVRWKLTARVRDEDAYTTPAGETLRLRVRDPRGTVVSETEHELNEFGGAWGALDALAEWPLGEYRAEFLRPGSSGVLGYAVLFRLEEYELPEFFVRVEPPTGEDGEPVPFRTGDPIRARIEAEYAFGGPVAGAAVEVQVHARAWWPQWEPKHRYPWFHRAHPPRWWGPGEHLETVQLVTDEDGVARLELTPSWGGDGDVEYTLEARVTDSSRREVSGSGTVRATRTAYLVDLAPRRRVYRPGETLEVEVRAQDANGRGVAAEGELLLHRETNYEVWLDPRGVRWTGERLRRERERYAFFPPPAPADEPGWVRIERGETSELVARVPARTDADGEGLARFPVQDAGRYRIEWFSTDRWDAEVRASTHAFVAAEGTHEIGYRADGVELFVDRDAVRVGEEAVVLVTTESPGWVLFSVEARGLLELRVVRVDGRAALLRLPVDQRWVPNVNLVAIGMVHGRGASDRESLLVPPVEHALDVDVRLDPAELRPGEEGALVVTARDADGEPVEAEVAVAVFDAMVESIQEDPAIDPRTFFHGDLRPVLVATGSSFEHVVYRRLGDDGEGGYRDDYRNAGPTSPGRRRADSDEMSGRARKLQALGYLEAESADGSRGPSDTVVPGRARAQADADAPAQDGGAQVVVRSDFRDTAFWSPDVRTGADGTARVTWTYPDNLTTWKATARAATQGADFGMALGEARTTKPLLARLQTPRFLVEGDEALISINLDNRTDRALSVHAELAAEGVELVGFLADGGPADLPESIRIEPRSGRRLDWLVRATGPGEATFTGSVVGEELADGIERSLPVVRRGIESLATASARIDGAGAVLGFDLPEMRAEGSTSAVVQVAPNLALSLVDALPYLIDYPYGCTEQTLSRFVPAVVVKKTIADFGLDPEIALQRSFGGITPAARAALFEDADRTAIGELDAVVNAGMARLADMQHGDGGWGWWATGSTDDWMTAYAVWSLSLAREAGVEGTDGMIASGAEYLARRLSERLDDENLATWMLHALASAGIGADERFAAGFDAIYAGRAELSAYGRALLCLAATRSERTAEAAVLTRNLIDGAVVRRPDRSLVQPIASGDGTAAPRAHWGSARGWRWWYHGGVETTAFCLRALLEADPDHELVEPAMQWLLANRRAAQWTNTRDTAISVLALASFLERKGNLDAPVEYEVVVNGTSVARERLEGDALLAGARRIDVPADRLRAGRNEVEVRLLEASNPVDVAVWAEFFSREEDIAPRGNELFVRRNWYKLVGRPTLLEGWVYDRVPLGNGDEVASGERIECVVTLEAKGDLEYLVVEDRKPAGFEAGEVKSGERLFARELTRAEADHRFGDERERSGVGARDSDSGSTTGTTGRARSVHQEWRERHVGLFLDRLPEGVWEVRYELRAETPGRFEALPLTGEAMYVPEIRANGRNLRVEVTERAE